jgi:acetyl-CoA carboxylase biotin carboxyl carrier protein
VADDPRNSPHPFDIQTIRALVQLMSRHELSEIDLREGEQRIRLCRGGLPVAVEPAKIVMAQQPHAPAAPTAPQAIAPAEKPSAKHLHEIKSPTIGTFYSQPEPGASAYVAVGTKVTPNTVVGLIEAMKVFNEITAGCSGTVVEILVENQQAVDYNQLLFRVDPSV